MKMVEMAVLEVFVLGDRFLNGFPVKMANWVFDPRRRLNYMMLLLSWLKSGVSESFTAALILLVTSREITAENLELIEDLVAALETDENLTEMVLISEVSSIDAG